MPGIAGVFDRKGKTDFEMVIPQMISRMTYEDWYRRGAFVKDGVGLGWVGLGFVKGEDQPMTDRSYTILLDGELYNADEVARRFGVEWVQGEQARLLLLLYRQHGSAFLKYLNGSFTFAIWDARAKRLFVANDRHGLCPLYYSRYSGKLVFCSKIRGILADNDFRFAINPSAVADFFTFEFVMDEKTFVEGIKIFPPASQLTYEDGRLTIKRYWEPVFEEERRERALSDFVEEFYHFMNQAVQRRMNGSSVGVALSGGFDSRTIAGVIGKDRLPFHTFTFGFRWSNDVRYARMIAKALGASHHFVPINPNYLPECGTRGVTYTDGMVNCIHFHIFNLLPEMRRYVQIVHEGNPGDVYGISIEPWVLNLETEEEFVKGVYTMWNTGVKVKFHRQFFRPEFSKKVEEQPLETLRKALSGAKAHSRVTRWLYPYLTQRVRRFTQYGKVNMESQVLVRQPFYDNDLMDFCLAMPDELRLRRSLHAEMIRKKLPHLAKIPRQDTGEPINPTRLQEAMAWRVRRLRRSLTTMSGGLIHFRDRRPFADYAGWFRTNLRPYISNLLLYGKPRLYEYIEEGFAKELISDHMQGGANHAGAIGCLMTFEHWLRGLENEGSEQMLRSSAC